MAIVTTGLICELVGKLANGGSSPGSGSLATWTDIVGAYDGSLSGFNFDASEGWVGAGSAGDPYGLKWAVDGNAIVDLGNTLLEGLTDWTIEFWLKPPASSTNSLRLFDCFTSATDGQGCYVSAASGYPYFFGYIGGTYYSDSQLGDTDLRNALHHVVITYGESGSADPDDYVRCYVDGVGQGYALITGGGTTGTHTSTFQLGNRASDLLRPFGGTFYTMRVYDVGFYGSLVTQNYNEGVLAASTDGALPTVTTTAVSAITAGTASSGGTITEEGGSAVTAYGVCWNTTGSPTTADSKTIDGP